MRADQKQREWDTDSARRARAGLDAMAWLAPTLGGLWILLYGVQVYLFAHQNHRAATPDLDTLLDLLTHAESVVTVLGFAALAVAAGRVAAAVPRKLPGRLGATAACLLGAMGLLTLVRWFVHVTAPVDFERLATIHSITQLAAPAAWAALALAVDQVGPRTGPRRTAVLALAIAAPIAWPLVFLLADRGAISLDWMFDHQTLVWSGHALATAVHVLSLRALAVGASRRIDDEVGPDTLAATPEDWARAGDGLRNFASALVARVVCVFGALVLMLLAYQARSPGLLKLTMVALPLAGVVTGLLMTAGLGAFARTPLPERPRSLASFTLALIVLGVLAESYGLYVVVRTLVSDGDYRPSQELMTHLQLGVQAIALIAYLAMLGALRTVAEHIGQADLAHRAAVLFPIVLVVVGGGGLLRFAWRDGDIGPDVALIAIAGAGIASLVTILAFTKLAHRIGESMHRGPAPATARARYRNPEEGS